MGQENRDKLGQLFSLLLVGGLVLLVAWFAKNFGPAGASDGGVADGGLADGALATDASAALEGGSAEDTGTGTDDGLEPSGLHTALFGAVVTEAGNAGDDEPGPFGLTAGEGCVIISSLGPELRLLRLRVECATLDYDSGQLDDAQATVTESLADDRPVHTLSYTTPPSSPGVRVSVDTNRETLTILGPSDEGRATARFHVEQWSAPRPGTPLTSAPASIEPEASDDPPPPTEPCPEDATFTGAVLTAASEFEPLTLRADEEGPRVDLFGAPVDTARDVAIDCSTGTARIVGPDSRYDGAIGPGGRTIIGRGEIAGEPALFWLRANQ